jgi:hypothetical protein
LAAARGVPGSRLRASWGSLVAAPGGYVATGSLGTTVGLWTSRNGIDRLPVAEVDLATADESSLLSDGRHVLLTARSQDEVIAFVTHGVDR